MIKNEKKEKEKFWKKKKFEKKKKTPGTFFSEYEIVN